MSALPAFFTRASCRAGRGVLFQFQSIALANGTHPHAIRSKSFDSGNKKPLVEQFKDNAQMIGSLVALMSAVALTTYSVIGTNKDLRKELELAEERAGKEIALAKKDITVVEERAKAEVAQAKAEVAQAKAETAERLLLYGFAAEYHEYQKKLKLSDHGKAESAEK